jgi:hypothetical protein
MPLLDHFRKPTETRAPWASVCGSWINYVMAQLNALLPADRYAAFGRTHLGADAEADISEFEMPGKWSPDTSEGGLAVAPPLATVETIVLDEFEVEVKDVRDDMSLVGVIEFVSPANKDRPETRRRLVSKCLRYLDLGVGVILVDIVTTARSNLHNELALELGARAPAFLPVGEAYLAGYRPSKDEDRWTINMWPYAVALGGTIPPVPLALKNGPIVPVDFESAYTLALAVHRL